MALHLQNLRYLPWFGPFKSPQRTHGGEPLVQAPGCPPRMGPRDLACCALHGPSRPSGPLASAQSFQAWPTGLPSPAVASRHSGMQRPALCQPLGGGGGRLGRGAGGPGAGVLGLRMETLPWARATRPAQPCAPHPGQVVLHREARKADIRPSCSQVCAPRQPSRNIV